MKTENYQHEIEDIRSRIERLLTLATEKTWSVETIDEKWDVKFMCRCGALDYQTRYIELTQFKLEEWKHWADQFASEIYSIYKRHRFDYALEIVDGRVSDDDIA